VHEDVQAIPALAQFCEDRINLIVVADIAGKTQVRVLPEPVGELDDPALELVVLLCKSNFGALARERLGDACGDGTIARDAHNECAFAGHEAHVVSFSLVRKGP
jgi:hypothetical protein